MNLLTYCLTYCYRLNVSIHPIHLPPPNVYVDTLLPSVMVSESGLGVIWRNLFGISAFLRKNRKDIWSLCHVKTQQEHGHLLARKSSGPRRTQPFWLLDLGLPASRNGRNKCSLLSYSVCGILLSS